MEAVANANIYAYQVLDQNTTNIVMDAFSNAILKLRHSHKYWKAFGDYSNLAEGLSILDSDQSLDSSLRR